MPENTFASFDLAVELGADMIELDLHPSSDGELFVMHDDTVDRTTDGHGKVSSLSSKQLKALNAAAKSSKNTPEPVPTFAEVLEKYRKKMQLMVEVKHGSSVYPGVERRVVDELVRQDALDQVELISFDLDCLRKIRQESTQVKIGSILIGNMASFADLLKGQVDALHGRWDFVTRAQVDHARNLGYPTHLWTPNSDAEITEVIRLGADGIVSNFPDKVIRVLAELHN